MAWLAWMPQLSHASIAHDCKSDFFFLWSSARSWTELRSNSSYLTYFCWNILQCAWHPPGRPSFSRISRHGASLTRGVWLFCQVLTLTSSDHCRRTSKPDLSLLFSDVPWDPIVLRSFLRFNQSTTLQTAKFPRPRESVTQPNAPSSWARTWMRSMPCAGKTMWVSCFDMVLSWYCPGFTIFWFFFDPHESWEQHDMKIIWSHWSWESLIWAGHFRDLRSVES